jgi:chromatin remodeling complex protein RSC6
LFIIYVLFLFQLFKLIISKEFDQLKDFIKHGKDPFSSSSTNKTKSSHSNSNNQSGNHSKDSKDSTKDKGGQEMKKTSSTTALSRAMMERSTNGESQYQDEMSSVTVELDESSILPLLPSPFPPSPPSLPSLPSLPFPPSLPSLPLLPSTSLLSVPLPNLLLLTSKDIIP